MAKMMGELLKEAVADAPVPQELIEASLGRVLQHVHGANIGIISAERGEHSKETNDANHAQLGHDIRKHGFGYVPIKGNYIENHGTPHEKKVSERSYMVVGKRGDDSGRLKGFLTKHGEKYKQDSVLHKPHDSTAASLHGTKEGAWPGKGEKHDVGEFHPNRAGEFHSQMKNRTFAFEQYLFYNPMGFFTRQERLFG
jgi:hypothetical protein